MTAALKDEESVFRKSGVTKANQVTLLFAASRRSPSYDKTVDDWMEVVKKEVDIEFNVLYMNRAGVEDFLGPSFKHFLDVSQGAKECGTL